MTARHSGLWSDDPASVDLLSFDAVGQTVADALLDDALDPVALGLSGSWGSGKTTVLNLVAQELGHRKTANQNVLVIQTDPWRYDPSTGAKESLIADVLDALAAEVASSATKTDEAKNLLVRLGKRIDWAKAIKLAATSSLFLQIPDFDKLVELVKPKKDDKESVRGLEEFRDEFAELLGSDDLKHIRAVAVLVDDLDRCLPETVVQSLEAMRLFLAVPKMSFVIAADEERVADAIRTRFKATGRPDESDDEQHDPATLYLHKIVQTTIPLPALSHFDTQAYLLLLQMQAAAKPEQFTTLIERCAQIRRDGGSIDDIGKIDGLAMDDELAFASRLTPLLYEKLRGNPRYIKRFLNDLHVRQSVASRRGINLDPAVVAKLMTIEALMKPEFKLLLDWFAKGQMRDHLGNLEDEAGRPAQPDTAVAEDRAESDGASEAASRPRDAASPRRSRTATPATSGQFSQAMVRWAKLAPPLRGLDLSPYLTLAASFAGITLIDDSLPERLRDIAANLLSESRRAQASVTDAELDELGDGDATDLLRHIGRTIRDQPAKQKAGVNAILRIARRRPGVVTTARDALLMLPPNEITIATPIQFKTSDPAAIRSVLTTWKEKLSDGQVKRSVESALGNRETT
ncbi:KAP family P-loop NTPase fold protein [Amycolatopsis cihanbeyliensis]|uniref:Putative KAP-like P-loop ATPase n=1 Tax=Amycolatopsis cihanbeyliensis TaxID=1128664 RepID=A0A542DPY0_AMYCI|nr:P-loop NTPase fold protein [Amycolatopsis cihanbeyliensis]TQJ05044.1 putative KAP-like P-loop ATPase [Amycolatopsis cihanbeyliensis]